MTTREKPSLVPFAWCDLRVPNFSFRDLLCDDATYELCLEPIKLDLGYYDAYLMQVGLQRRLSIEFDLHQDVLRLRPTLYFDPPA